jgi:CheY-like chemotaxis protein
MPSATVSSSKATPVAADHRELRILLVEDSPPLRARLAELLTDAGIMRVIATAATEFEACELIASCEFDALVVDVELREGSGIAVVRFARARRPGAPEPLIIILTNFALPTIRDRCLAAGADHFLDKMHQFDQLYPLILARRG